MKPHCAEQRDALQATLDDEFAFVATCNVGGEFLSPDKQARLREIGARQLAADPG